MLRAVLKSSDARQHNIILEKGLNTGISIGIGISVAVYTVLWSIANYYRITLKLTFVIHNDKDDICNIYHRLTPSSSIKISIS